MEKIEAREHVSKLTGFLEPINFGLRSNCSAFDSKWLDEPLRVEDFREEHVRYGGVGRFAQGCF